MMLLIGMFIALTTALKFDEYLVVNTLQGPVKGYKSTEGEFYGFYGIPYATEPKGRDKFKPPLPAPTWNDTFEAIDHNVACAQVQNDAFNYVFANNCLLTNIFVPNTNEKNLSVLVYIHGGRYQANNGLNRQPKRLAAEGNIITVTFNYRLGANGFLCLGTENAPGNVGLKDQIALLHWVQNNIAYFGGNPHDVTLAGSSAGSTSVDILLLSKLTEGLFTKIIQESGFAAGWSLQQDPVTAAVEYAATFGFYPNDINELEEFYQTLPLDALTKIGTERRPDSSFTFLPCLEKKDDKTAVISEEPLDIIKTQKHNRVPLLSGITSLEGLTEYGVYPQFKTLYQKDIIQFLPPDIKIIDLNEQGRIAKLFRDTYFYNDTATILSYVRHKSDQIFKYPAIRLMKARAAVGFDVYYYYYTFYDETSQPLYLGAPGAEHCAQTNAVNEVPSKNITYNETNLSKDYKIVRKQMRKLWISFVKNSRPVMEATEQYPQGWPPVTAAGYPYMSLGFNSELKNTEMDPEIMNIWEDLYSKYYVKPVPPRDTI